MKEQRLTAQRLRRLRIACAAAVMAMGSISQARGQPVRIVFDGDSVAAGQGASGDARLAPQVAQIMRLQGKLTNVAVSGQPVLSCLARFDSIVQPLFEPGATNVIFFHAGDNDIKFRFSAPEIYRRLTEYIALAHRQGWKVVVSTELPRYDFPPNFETQLLEYNRLILQNSAKADRIADFASNSAMGGPQNRSNPAFYSGDGVHPSAGGYNLLARQTADEIASLIR